MSARTRFLWIVPAVLMAFWLAFQSVAAVPPPDGWSAPRRERQLGDPQPPLTVAGEAIVDRLLRQRIAGFAASARARN